MRILAIDMGRSKSVLCDYVAESAEHEYQKISTDPATFHDVITTRKPDVVVIEISPAAGWVKDLCDALGQNLIVANTADEAWQWRKVKNKTDRKDALKLAKMQAMKQISPVHIPALKVRQWRALIHYRHTLCSEGTAIRNRIRGVLDGVAIKLAPGGKAFGKAAREQWREEMCRVLSKCAMEQLWRGIIEIELRRLEELERHLATVEDKLAEIAKQDDRVQRVLQAPSVGERTAELTVALLDDPKRFGRGKQVGNYAGLTPKKWQSGEMDRTGRISRGGCGLWRALLVQASWIGIRSVPWMRQLYERVRRGSETRKKKAIVAVARHLLIRLWAMLRDGTCWREPMEASVVS